MARAAADSSVFHAIADPTRRAILDLLRQETFARLDEDRRTVMAMFARIAAAAGLTQSAFSQHLKVLLNAGLVTVRKQGRSRIYSLRARPLTEVSAWIAEYDAFWTGKLEGLGRYLDQQHGGQRAPQQTTTNSGPTARARAPRRAK